MVTLQYYTKTFMAVFPQKFSAMRKIWLEKQQLESKILKGLGELKRLEDDSVKSRPEEYYMHARLIKAQHEKLRGLASGLVEVVGKSSFFDIGTKKRTLRHTTSTVLRSLQTIQSKQGAIAAEAEQQNPEVSRYFFQGFFAVLPELTTSTNELLHIINKKGELLANYLKNKYVHDFEFAHSYAFWCEMEESWIERMRIQATKLRALRKEILAIIVKQFRKQKAEYYDRNNYVGWFLIPLLIIGMTGFFMFFAKPDLLQEYFRDVEAYFGVLDAAMIAIPLAISAFSKTIRDVTFTITASVQELAS